MNQIICVAFCFCENNGILCAPSICCFERSSGYTRVVVIIFRFQQMGDNGFD